MNWELLAVFMIAGLLGLGGTWLVRRLAPRVGLLDAPDGVRKLQRRPVPVGGGLAVFAAALAASGLALILDPGVAAEFAANPRPWVALAIAAAVIIAVGIIDDRLNLRARYKLTGQLAAATVLVVGGGVLIPSVHLFGLEIPLGRLSVPVTYLWLLAAVNALNLLDGMDGLLGTVGLIVCGALASIAVLAGHPLAAAVAFAVAGGLVGFLRFNLPPATIYSGDCGSMLVGLVAGAVAILGSMKSQAFALVVPAAVLVLPFLDTSAAIVRRKLTGRGMAMADRDHLHHVLLRRGWTVPRALTLLAALGTVAAVGGLASAYWRNDMIALITAAGVILVLLAFGLFGVTEMRLVRDRAAAALRAARLRTAPGRAVERVIPRADLSVPATPAMPPAQLP